MSTMPGNPHYDDSVYWKESDTPDTGPERFNFAQIEATLALAYEQRTANLIALWQMDEESAVAFNHANNIEQSAWATVPRQIATRLGIKETP